MTHWYKRVFAGILVLEALSPCLFYTWEFTCGSSSRNHVGGGFFDVLVVQFHSELQLLFFGLPYWILFIVGLFLRLTSLAVLSAGCLAMAIHGLWIYYTVYEPYNPVNMGDEGMVFGLLFLYQIAVAPVFALFILLLNWLLKKFTPALP